MELIKQIKKAEAESKQIIEAAETEAAKVVAASVTECSGQIEQAALLRNKTIEKAIEQGRKQGLLEAEKLKAQAEATLENLCGNAKKKISSAAGKVTEAIKK